MNDWEVYKKSSKVTRSKKYISVTRSKTFGLPRPFLDAYNIEGDVKAVIIYNPKEKKVALRFSKANPEFGYALRYGTDKTHGAMIVARKFFEDKDIDAADYAGHYDYEKVPLASLGFPNAEGDAFIIRLKKKDVKEKNGVRNSESADIPF